MGGRRWEFGQMSDGEHEGWLNRCCAPGRPKRTPAEARLVSVTGAGVKAELMRCTTTICMEKNFKSRSIRHRITASAFLIDAKGPQVKYRAVLSQNPFSLL